MKLGKGIIVTVVYIIMIMMILGVGIIANMTIDLPLFGIIFVYTLWFGLCMALALIGVVIINNIVSNVQESLYDS